MTGRKTGILMHRNRIISKTHDRMIVWLTPKNLDKFRQRLIMNIYFGSMSLPWENDGSYKLVKKIRKVKHDRGLKYYKCELARIDRFIGTP